jgi:hypothetical protein
VRSLYYKKTIVLQKLTWLQRSILGFGL